MGEVKKKRPSILINSEHFTEWLTWVTMKVADYIIEGNMPDHIWCSGTRSTVVWNDAFASDVYELDQETGIVEFIAISPAP